mmetsp:Transcript_14019/g.23815  ORF Transcript_14019/g.23815 Transcript_14019/m.23815 type:complete len:217 (-) Transcript_14019:100-750(-)|eukprot:CAMPEP_0168623704 /NCGR_PEP_ID=MMETSP0449_2-20121227/8975_1 /TAXON_ID=1082188 /ORGANISM="Strombidium rassoulzadegani, Strain ras09" /LENGTH=216 /DNA_ID=CAMNT_0008665119 /DNA_START=19 /DNA_END=669 /DNA_ORIENTATION=-
MATQAAGKLWMMLSSFIGQEGDNTPIEVPAVNDVCGTNVVPLADFDASRYFGVWYEQVHVKDFIFQPGNSACIEAQYIPNDDGTFKVVNSYQDDSDALLKQIDELGPRDYTVGSAKCDEGVGACYVSFFQQPLPDEPNYIVAHTDYENYSIVYSCSEKNQAKLVWILSREPNLDTAKYNEVLDIVKTKVPGFDFSRFEDLTPQGDKCDYASDMAAL